MATTTLVPQKHSIKPDQTIVEVWHDGKLIGTVYGSESGPGIRIISKHTFSAGTKRDCSGTGELFVGIEEVPCPQRKT